MSLPEMIVYILLSIIVVAAALGMFTSGLASQANTKARDSATGSADIATNSLLAGIRNASAFKVSGSLLRARVAVRDGTSWECQAWAVTPGKKLVHTASAGAIGGSPDYSTWATLATGVTGILPSSPGVRVPFIDDSNTRVRYGFEVAVNGVSVPIEGSAAPQAAGGGIPAACW